MSNVITILWADDEIDLLKPQVMFLEKKGYSVITVTNGHDAIEECEEYNDIDVVFLDESMPGLTGLETLMKIKEINPHLPVVMITKNEAENVMEEAIGSQITDLSSFKNLCSRVNLIQDWFVSRNINIKFLNMRKFFNLLIFNNAFFVNGQDF